MNENRGSDRNIVNVVLLSLDSRRELACRSAGRYADAKSALGITFEGSKRRENWKNKQKSACGSKRNPKSKQTFPPYQRIICGGDHRIICGGEGD